MAKTGRTGVQWPTIVAIGVVVVLAVAVFGGVALFGGSGSSGSGTGTDTSAGTPPVSAVTASYPTAVRDGVVVAGTGPRVLDVYEDALCPACRQFEQLDGQQITDALAANRVTVRYHLVNLLDDRSDPPGYSTLGGNALLCAADNGAFPTLHRTLYDRQPSEGGRGYDTEQLVTLGQQAGAAPAYADCVRAGTHAAQIAQNYAAAQADPALAQTSGGQTVFGTPTIVVDGRQVQAGSPELTAALA